MVFNSWNKRDTGASLAQKLLSWVTKGSQLSRCLFPLSACCLPVWFFRGTCAERRFPMARGSGEKEEKLRKWEDSFSCLSSFVWGKLYGEKMIFCWLFPFNNQGNRSYYFMSCLLFKGPLTEWKGRTLFFLLVFSQRNIWYSYFPQRRKLWFSSTNTVSMLKRCQKHLKHMHDPLLV